MIFIFLSFLIYLFYKKSGTSYSKSGQTCFFLFLYAAVFALRDMTVADTEPYYETYTGIIDPNMELGYLYINYLFSSSDISFRFFLFLVACFDLTLWFFCTKKILKQNNLLLALFVFMSNMGLLYYGIVLRAGMANAIMYIPLAMILFFLDGNEMSGLRIKDIFKKKIILFVLLYCLFLFLASLFHQSVFILVVALPLVILPLNDKIRYMILALAFLVYFYPGVFSWVVSIAQPFMEANELRGAYRLEGDVHSGVSYSQIINIIIGVIYIVFAKSITDERHKQQYNFVLNLYVLGVLVSGIFSFITAGTRLGHMLCFYDFLLPAILANCLGDIKSLKRLYSFVLFLVFINLIRLYVTVPSLWEYLTF